MFCGRTSVQLICMHVGEVPRAETQSATAFASMAASSFALRASRAARASAVVASAMSPSASAQAFAASALIASRSVACARFSTSWTSVGPAILARPARPGLEPPHRARPRLRPRSCPWSRRPTVTGPVDLAGRLSVVESNWKSTAHTLSGASAVGCRGRWRSRPASSGGAGARGGLRRATAAGSSCG